MTGDCDMRGRIISSYIYIHKHYGIDWFPSIQFVRLEMFFRAYTRVCNSIGSTRVETSKRTDQGPVYI